MERACDVCGTRYHAQRSSSRYCSGTCRTRATKAGLARGKRQAEPVGIRPVIGGVVDATRAELVAAGRLESSAGQRALKLAALLDDPPPATLSAMSGWSREHGAAMEQALREQPASASSALDEIKARRDAKRRGA